MKISKITPGARVACVNLTTGQIEFRAVNKVTEEEVIEEDAVQFIHINFVKHLDGDSGPHGPKFPTYEWSNRVGFAALPGSKLYCVTGRNISGYHINWDNQGNWANREVSTLLPNTIKRVARLCCRTEGITAPPKGILELFFDKMGLKTKVQQDAFIELAGYHAGDGSSSYSKSTDPRILTVANAVMFSPIKPGELE